MGAPFTAIVSEPIRLDSLSAAIEDAARARAEGCGGACSFVGVVRSVHKGRAVRYLEYEAFEPMASKALAQIVAEACAEWPTATLGIQHRIGRIEIGEASVGIVAASPHRAEAFRACRYAIERVKQIAPIWKHEFFVDGEAWVEGAVADPTDAAARREALDRACA